MSEQKHLEPPKPKEDAFRIDPNPGSNVKKVIAVMSGKGGVGKSSVTGLLALLAKRQGLKVAILDADITGPSIPTMFGVTFEDVSGNEQVLYPAETVTGFKIMSMNLLTDDVKRPVVWRSPIITGAIKQFWTDVAWGDVDLMLIDMPPGTGDVPLTVFQSFPVSGIVVVTTPQDLVGMIVEKSIGMAKMMNVPVYGLIENMAYFTCPHCGEKTELFGTSHAAQVAAEQGVTLLGRLPVAPSFAAASDIGKAEYFDPEEIAGDLTLPEDIFR